MEITLKNKCYLYVIITIRFFSIAICNLFIDFLSYIAYNIFNISFLQNGIINYCFDLFRPILLAILKEVLISHPMW